MLIGRSHVIRVLRARGTLAEAAEAERVLPAQVDSERERQLLADVGIDPDSRAEGGELATESRERQPGLVPAPDLKVLGSG